MELYHIAEMPPREVFPGARGWFFHTEHMTIIHWVFEQGALLPEHSHPHEQVSNFIEGEFEFTIGQEARRLGPGSVVVIPPNVKHSARALSRTYVIDVFYPTREDYRQGGRH